MSADEAIETKPRRLFLSVPEVATMAGVDPRAVRNGIAKGDIPATRFGRMLRVPTTWLDQQLAIDPASGDSPGEGNDAA